MNDWISVNDELPEQNEYGNSKRVIVYVESAIYVSPHTGEESVTPIGIVTVGQYHNTGWSTISWAYIGSPHITHWMPLPEPPEQDRE